MESEELGVKIWILFLISSPKAIPSLHTPHSSLTLISLLAVNRWSERIAGEAPGNSLEVLLDERFPDARMESVYANMDF